jgi:hypothetical protein
MEIIFPSWSVDCRSSTLEQVQGADAVEELPEPVVPGIKFRALLLDVLRDQPEPEPGPALFVGESSTLIFSSFRNFWSLFYIPEKRIVPGNRGSRPRQSLRTAGSRCR